jgi:hypothetical protein
MPGTCTAPIDQLQAIKFTSAIPSADQSKIDTTGGQGGTRFIVF